MICRQGSLIFSCTSLLVSFIIAGCASGRKQKLEQREKLAAISGLYCDFINGDKNKEVELELNMMMAKKCDSEKAFSITNYRTPAEVTGVLYCCAIKKTDVRAPETKSDKNSLTDKKPDLKSDAKSDGKTTTPSSSSSSTGNSTNSTNPKGVNGSETKGTPNSNEGKSNSTIDLEEEIVPL
jgi:hypothetical protein